MSWSVANQDASASFIITNSAAERASGLCNPLLGGTPAAFTLLNDPAGEEALVGFYCPYLRLARALGAGMLLEAPTAWATAAWMERWNLSGLEPAAINRQAVAFVSQIRDFFDPSGEHVRLGGTMAPLPHGSAGSPSREAALLGHFEQAECLAAAGVDLLVATAMTQPEEAIGLTMAAAAVERPLLIYLAPDDQGRLGSGQPLVEAIEEIDAAFSPSLRPACYGLECRDQRQAQAQLRALGPLAGRLRALRLSTPLFPPLSDREMAGAMRDDPTWCCPEADLCMAYPQLTIFGGGFLKRGQHCCQTDLLQLAA